MHNIHFVIWLAMYEGRYALAMEYARKIEKWLPEGDKNSGVQFLLGGVVPMGAVFLEVFFFLVCQKIILTPNRLELTPSSKGFLNNEMACFYSFWKVEGVVGGACKRK